ncbi:MAG: hypothetical protein ACRDPG_09925 [Nocardioidaceae bacterium]
MFITNHVLSGAVIGLVAPGPGTALAVGVASHFALDAAPHFGLDDLRLMQVAVPDGLVGLVAAALVTATAPSARRTSLLAGVFGACVPDLDKPGRVFFDRSPFPSWLDRFHSRIQNEAPGRFPVEVAAAITLSAAFAVLARRCR